VEDLAAAAALVGLLGGGVAGVAIEREMIVRPCVRALDTYRKVIHLTDDFVTNRITYATAMERGATLRAQLIPAEWICRG
jgi:hypothetical protein